MTRGTHRSPGGNCKQAGFTLIEVLVTVIILAMGLLGLAGMQLNSMVYTHSAYQRSQATIMTNDIIDRMRANRVTAESGAYNIATGTQPDETSCIGAGANCTPTDLAAADLFEWKQALASLLPSGDGAVTQNGLNFTITITWDDTRGAEEDKTLIVETIL